MRCCKCGVEAIVLKTVIRRDDADRQGILCDPCWLPLRNRLWIVPGPVSAFGRCSRCGSWESARDLTQRKLGGGHGAWIGMCEDCVG